MILAGGQARRMGGLDKGLVPLAGRPMVEHVLDRIRPQVDEVLISANRNQDVYAGYGHRVIADVVGDYSGPLAGMLSALLVVKHAWLAVVPCDSPLLPNDLVERLLASVVAESAELAVAHDGERLQPVVALLHRSLSVPLRAFLEGGGRKIDRWYRQHRMVTTDLSDHPEAFANVNTPEDLAVLERQVPGPRPPAD
ncbi:molybdopterin-guanine dinucleotide biosynthesis protein A [Thioalkalivibrio paradoxus ARh 1]|uniref:Molybdenum cofactor guanylyltransferase n=1 Tax=Thioalkalivibrio paradoxus ARh 1 TaxID=713585 RepID=W0DJ52_9GAMM|nr:molybdopterin-guanine dinucleotide biosynthesis protein A [Thioalkalivibrio paradoxus ARh 1]